MEKAWTLGRSICSIRNREYRLATRQATPGGDKQPIWTETEIEMLKKLTNREVAKRTGRSGQAVAVQRARLRRLGENIPLDPSRRWWSEAEDHDLHGAFDAGIPASQLALQLERTEGSVYSRARTLGIDLPEDPDRWSWGDLATIQNPNLTVDQMVKATGRTKIAIASKRHKLRKAGIDIPKRCRCKRLG